MLQHAVPPEMPKTIADRVLIVHLEMGCVPPGVTRETLMLSRHIPLSPPSYFDNPVIG